jgi:hypothetical protein
VLEYLPLCRRHRPCAPVHLDSRRSRGEYQSFTYDYNKNLVPGTIKTNLDCFNSARGMY